MSKNKFFGNEEFNLPFPFPVRFISEYAKYRTWKRGKYLYFQENGVADHGLPSHRGTDGWRHYWITKYRIVRELTDSYAYLIVNIEPTEHK